MHDIIKAMPFDHNVKTYLTGRFEEAGRQDSGKHEMSGKELHQILRDLRENTSDGVSEYHVEKLTGELEKHFTESLGKK